MHIHSLDPWQHRHHYRLETEHLAERRTRWVMGLTVAMMLVELVAGYLSGSMALTADGWHMGSHAAALGIATFAYAFARRHADNARFTFGTGKVGPLAGFTSAVVLGIIALLMALQSVDRLLSPVTVRFNEAIAVAVAGLLVNVVSALMLGHDHSHHHDRDHEDDAPAHREHRHSDHNLQAAYLHVVADALTSVLAVVALLAGKLLGWVWMDPVMGLVGAALIARWSAGLLRDTGQVLLDAEDNARLAARVAARIEEQGDSRIADLHLWRVGPASHACIVSLVTHYPQPAERYKAVLAAIPGLDHVTVEVNACLSEGCHWADGMRR